MGVKTFLFLCLAFATKFMLVQAEIDEECVYEGQRFKADRWGQLPLETHRNCETEIECKEKCDSKFTCVIWQWQPTRKICWIMNVKPYRDGNSDFGINHCDKGKPTENAPQCQVTKGDRNNVWQDYKDMTRDECIAQCDSDCLIWQHIKNRKLCRIHKLEVDLSKQSQVGIHYCGISEVTSTNSTEPSSSCNGLNRGNCKEQSAVPAAQSVPAVGQAGPAVPAVGQTGGQAGPAVGQTGGHAGPAVPAVGQTGGQAGPAVGQTGGHAGPAVGQTGGQAGPAVGQTGGHAGPEVPAVPAVGQNGGLPPLVKLGECPHSEFVKKHVRLTSDKSLEEVMNDAFAITNTRSDTDENHIFYDTNLMYSSNWRALTLSEVGVGNKDVCSLKMMIDKYVYCQRIPADKVSRNWRCTGKEKAKGCQIYHDQLDRGHFWHGSFRCAFNSEQRSLVLDYPKRPREEEEE